jgi:hypothetical protein
VQLLLLLSAAALGKPGELLASSSTARHASVPKRLHEMLRACCGSSERLSPLRQACWTRLMASS